MSEVLISPGLDKSLNANSFVELGKSTYSPSSSSSSSSSVNSTVKSGPVAQSSNPGSVTTFRLPLKQAAKTLFREKSTNNDNNHNNHSHNNIINNSCNSINNININHQANQVVESIGSNLVHLSTPSSSKLDSNNRSDCSNNISSVTSCVDDPNLVQQQQQQQQQQIHLPINALAPSSTDKSNCNRNNFRRSSIITTVLNSNSDILKQLNSKILLSPFKSSSTSPPPLIHDEISINKSTNCSSSACLDSPNLITLSDTNNWTTAPSTATSVKLISSINNSNVLHSPPNSSPSQSPPNALSSTNSSSTSSLMINSSRSSRGATNGVNHLHHHHQYSSQSGQQHSGQHRASISSSIASPSSPVAPIQTKSSNGKSSVNSSNNSNEVFNENGQSSTNFNPNAPGRRDPKCARCQNHNVFTKVKGHKLLCPFKTCKCKKCRLVKRRQKIMAKQVKVRRAQTSYGENRLESDQIDALIGDDDIDDDDEDEEVEDGENSRLGNTKSTTGSSIKNTNSSEKGFLMENLLRVDEDKNISPALLDSFYQLLLIRLSTMNMSIAYELALRMATSSVLELASISKVNSNDLLEKKFESAIGFIKNRYSNYYPFYDSNVLSTLITADSRSTSSSNPVATGGGNLDIAINSPVLSASASASETGGPADGPEVTSGHKIHLPMVDHRSQHLVFNNNHHNQLTGNPSTGSTAAAHHHHTGHHGHHHSHHHLHHALHSRDTTGHNLLRSLGHLHLYATDETNAGGPLLPPHHPSNHFTIHTNHTSSSSSSSSLHRPNSSPESPNLTESTGQFRNYNRINSVSSSTLSSSSPSPPS